MGLSKFGSPDDTNKYFSKGSSLSGDCRQTEQVRQRYLKVERERLRLFEMQLNSTS